jgi:hypothetical protein
MKTTSRLLTTLLLFLSVSLAAPNARAVVPPPDGGYPGFNTAEGTKALFSLTAGSANTAVGWFSLFSNAGGSFNTATGAGSLLFNTADENTAFGTAALLSNTTGYEYGQRNACPVQQHHRCSKYCRRIFGPLQQHYGGSQQQWRQYCNWRVCPGPQRDWWR